MALVSATFFDRGSADQAVQKLCATGYGPDRISVVMSAATRKKYFDTDEPAAGSAIEDDESSNRAALGGLVGGALGAVALGGLILAVVASGGVAGPLVAGGLAAALAGAGGGVAAGGIIGGIVAGGLQAETATSVMSDVEAGGIAVIVDARDDEVHEVHRILTHSLG